MSPIFDIVFTHAEAIENQFSSDLSCYIKSLLDNNIFTITDNERAKINEVGDINNIHHHIKVTNFQDTSKDMLQDRNGYPIITGQVINKVNPNRGTYWLN